jgi:hypothetical protein
MSKIKELFNWFVSEGNCFQTKGDRKGLKSIIEAEIEAEISVRKEAWKKELLEKLPNGEQLHQWYLEAIEELHPISYNKNAQKPYNELSPEQKYIDEYIAQKIKKLIEEI